MSKAKSKPLPLWAVLLGSIAIAFHLFALAIVVIAAPSGPWSTPFGPSPATEPYFAGTINNITINYLRPLQLTSNYHFLSNHTDIPSVYFEIRFSDRKGKEIDTLKFPQDNVNFWVRQRQSLLAKSLGDDQPVQAPRGVAIPAPGAKSKTVNIWKGEKVLKLEEIPEYEIPKDRPAFRPSKWSLLLAKSYMRYAIRNYGNKYDKAAKVELIRHSRDPVRPENMVLGRTLPGAFDEMICNFGEYEIEK